MPCQFLSEVLETQSANFLTVDAEKTQNAREGRTYDKRRETGTAPWWAIERGVELWVKLEKLRDAS